MNCIMCGTKLSTSRPGAMYCHANCRAAAYRKRHGIQTRAELRAQASPSAKKPLDWHGRSQGSQDAVARISFDRQLIPQAPVSAFGYRLLVSREPDQSRATYVPALGTCWTLAPFQPPDDVLLEPGYSYRVVWVDQETKEIPLENTGSIPALYFFLGPPDPIPPTAQELDALIRACSQLRAKALRVNSLRERLRTAREDIKSLRKANDELIAEKEKLSQTKKRLRRKIEDLEDAIDKEKNAWRPAQIILGAIGGTALAAAAPLAKEAIQNEKALAESALHSSTGIEAATSRSGAKAAPEAPPQTSSPITQHKEASQDTARQATPTEKTPAEKMPAESALLASAGTEAAMSRSGAEATTEALPQTNRPVTQNKEAPENTASQASAGMNKVPSGAAIHDASQSEPTPKWKLPTSPEDDRRLFQTLKKVQELLGQPLAQLEEETLRKAGIPLQRKCLRRMLVAYPEQGSQEEELSLRLRKLRRLQAAIDNTCILWVRLLQQLGSPEKEVKYSERTTTLIGGLSWLRHEFASLGAINDAKQKPFVPHVQKYLPRLQAWLEPGVQREDRLASVLFDCLSVIYEVLVQAIVAERKNPPDAGGHEATPPDKTSAEAEQRRSTNAEQNTGQRT